MEAKQKKNLIKELGQVFKDKPIESTKIPESELKGYMDGANVMMIVPLTREFKALIQDNYDVTENKVPELHYLEGDMGASKFSTDYLKIILTLCREYDYFKLETRKDYPLRLTTSDFIVILAPRVDGD